MVSVLITERFSLETLIKMQNHSQLNVIHDCEWYQKPSPNWNHINILIIRSQTRIDVKLLNQFPNLKLIITATAGFDHIDLNLCIERKLTVCHCPQSHTLSAAELTWGLILTCSRRIIEAQNAVRNGDWDRNKIMGTELAHKTLGIVGLGRVGTKVAQIAKAFSLSVLAYDPFQEDEIFIQNSVERVSLEELLSQSEIVSLHVPLTKNTKHLLGELYLESLSSESILINTCRGPVIHEKALIHKLESKKIGAVGLDVFEYEPLSKDSSLFHFKNVITTPHIGATTREAFQKASEEAFSKVLNFINNIPISNELPPKESWFI